MKIYTYSVRRDCFVKDVYHAAGTTFTSKEEIRHPCVTEEKIVEAVPANKKKAGAKDEPETVSGEKE